MTAVSKSGNTRYHCYFQFSHAAQHVNIQDVCLLKVLNMSEILTVIVDDEAWSGYFLPQKYTATVFNANGSFSRSSNRLNIKIKKYHWIFS